MEKDSEQYFNSAYQLLYRCNNSINYYVTLQKDRNYVFRFDDYIAQTKELVEEALDLLTEAIIRSDKVDIAYKFRGDAYVILEDYDAALEDFNTTIKINPRYEKAFISRGKLFKIQGNYDSSLKDFNTAIRLNNKNAEAFFCKANLINTKSIEQSIVYYNECLRLNPDNPKVLYNRGMSYFKSGNKEKAIQDFKNGVSLCKSLLDQGKIDHRIYCSLAHFNFRLNNFDKSFENLNNAINQLGFNYEEYLSTLEVVKKKIKETKLTKPDVSEIIKNSKAITKFLFFDTETTGVPKNYKAPASDLNNWPRLVQLGFLLYDQNKKLIASGDYIIKPNGFTIPKEASKVHGITTERALKEGKDLRTVLNDILGHIIKADYLIAHNMAFDEKILGAELIRNGFSNIIEKKNRICTMEATTEFCAITGPYGYKWPKLSELHIKLFGKDFDGAHNAFADIEATARCFWKLTHLNIIKVKIESKRNNAKYFDIEQALEDYYEGENHNYELLYNEYLVNEKLGAFNRDNLLSHYQDRINPSILVPFRKGKLWGLSDFNKNIVLECVFKEITPIKNGFKAKTDSETFFIDEFGVLTNKVVNDALDDSGLARIYKNKKYGFVDIKGNEVVHPNYDFAFSPKEGMIAVNIGGPWDGDWGFIDLNGKIIIPFQFETVSSFSEGLAAVCYKGKCGFINKKGKIIIDLKYDLIDYGPEGFYCGVKDFKNGYAGVRLNGMWGLIDKNGKTIVEHKYSEVRDYTEGLAAVERETQKDTHCWGFVNQKGVEVIKCQYVKIGDIVNGLAEFEDYTNSKMGFINYKGQEVIPPIYREVSPFSEGLAMVEDLKGKCGFIDFSGKVIIPFEYISATDFNEGLALVRRRPGNWLYIDKNNNDVFSQEYYEAFPFKDGIAKVEKLGFDFGYIDKKGTEFWEDSVEQIKEAIDIAIKMNYLIQFKYQKSSVFSGGEISFRTIKPNEFEQIGESLCINGHCYLRNAERVFSLERISGLVIDPETIECWEE
jgi:DNA polymerase-3 subunit epsilon